MERNYRHTPISKRLSKVIGHSKLERNYRHTPISKRLSKVIGHSKMETNQRHTPISKSLPKKIWSFLDERNYLALTLRGSFAPGNINREGPEV